MTMGSYPGWEQARAPARRVDYSPWTHILHFGHYPGPNGELDIGDLRNDHNAREGVRAAHAAGKKIILVVGGEGEGSRFVRATSPRHRQRFVASIAAAVRRHGYDGVSIDWEEEVVATRLVWLVKYVRAALDAHTPRPMLVIDVAPGLVSPPLVARIHDMVDTVNVMSYWSDGREQIESYLDAGVPANKLVVGIGLSADYDDATVAKVEAKVRLVRRLGLAGVEAWTIGALDPTGDDPRLAPIRQLAETCTAP